MLMNRTFKHFALTVALLLVGFMTRDFFLDYSISQVTNKNAQIVSYNLGGQFASHLVFAVVIGMLPLTYLTVKHFGKLTSLGQSFIAYSLIVLSGIGFWQYRIYQLQEQTESLLGFTSGTETKIPLDFERLYFTRYLFLGFLTGAILSVLIFRIVNRNVVRVVSDDKE